MCNKVENAKSVITIFTRITFVTIRLSEQKNLVKKEIFGVRKESDEPATSKLCLKTIRDS